MSESEFGLEPVNGDTEWSASYDTETELIHTSKGRRKRTRRRNICIAIIIAASLVTLVTVSVVIIQRTGDNSPITITEWLTTSCSNADPQPKCPWKGVNPLLLVSMNGFRADYLHRNITPVLNKLQHCGVQTPYLRPVYPTKTYPTQYTIVTGLYPESHGIVNDGMYDATMQTEFSESKADPKWWGGEPLWETAKKQGKRTASCNWAGSNITDSKVDLQCDGTEDNDNIINKVLGWLSIGENGGRPDLVTVYFSEPGTTGRHGGHDSPEVYLKVKTMDDLIGKLMTGLHSHGIDNCVNIIVVSDHGMSDTSCLRQVSLDNLMEDADDVTKHLLKYDGTSGFIYTDFKRRGVEIVPNTNGIDTEEASATLACANSHLKVFTNSTVPIRHHYSNNDRIGDIVVDVENKWLVVPEDSKTCPKGSSGYDEVYQDMHAIFLGFGPDLKHDVKTEPFESIELYNLMSELLKIPPATNNGTYNTLNHLLRDSQAVPDDKTDISQCKGSNSRSTSCNCTLQVQDLVLPDSESQQTFPFGSPALDDDGVAACFLYGRQFSTIYNSENKQPVAVSYQLTKYQTQNFRYDETLCSIPDRRLADSVNPDCVEYSNAPKEIEAVHLYDHGFSLTEDDIAESYLSSNIVPMYKAFKMDYVYVINQEAAKYGDPMTHLRKQYLRRTSSAMYALTFHRIDIWSFLWSLVKQYALHYERIHISAGPIFDYDRDGRVDKHNTPSLMFVNDVSKVPIPTHFYVIMSKCSKDVDNLFDCAVHDLDILSVVLPHNNIDSDCQSPEDYLRDNVARVRDIELLTGLQMLTRFDSNTAARKRTYLPTALWPSKLLARWVDLPCDEERVCQSDYKPLVLISMDGFRADYIERNLTHAIDKLRRCGVRTPYMRSVFPTESYPVHQTIVTGLYPASHGVVENTMYDSKLNMTFDEHTEMNPKWWGGEPIWVTAKEQGKRSASIFWFGSNLDDPAKQPSIMPKVGFKESDTLQHGVEQLISLLTMEEGQRPDLVTFYGWQPDETGHDYGPDSTQMNEALKSVDQLIQLFMDGLLRNDLHTCVNIILVSDHGMAEASCQKQIVLKDYYPDIENVLTHLGTTGILTPRYREEGSAVVENDNVVSDEEIMEAFECKNKNYQAYTKETMPVRYHYTNNDRIGDIVLDIRNGWIVSTEKRDSCPKGVHGYEPGYKDMRAFFLAHGPSFKQDYEVEPFENIELYNIMADIMSVTPAPNNGTVGALEHILRYKSDNEDHSVMYRIEPCEGTNERTSTCKCQREIPRFTPGVHTYHGGLALQNDSMSMCSLATSLFATVYSKNNRQPAMVSYLLTPKQVTLNPITSTECVIPDPTFTDTENPDCDQYENIGANISRVHLFNPRYATSPLEVEMTKLSSNMVPMYSGFLTNIWSPVTTFLEHYVTQYKKLHVSVGPIFDRNYDGLADMKGDTQRFVSDSSDVPIPTHFFIILLKCKDETIDPVDCETRNIDTHSFILPHVDRIPNCKSLTSFLTKNVVRIKDIELLTGLRFLTNAEWTLAARKRTFLPEQLWSID